MSNVFNLTLKGINNVVRKAWVSTGVVDSLDQVDSVANPAKQRRCKKNWKIGFPAPVLHSVPGVLYLYR